MMLTRSDFPFRSFFSGWLFVLLAMVACCLFPPAKAQAQPRALDVTNIAVSVQSSDAVKARDEAILQAQRKGFAVLLADGEAAMERITDDAIANLVRGFSVRDEKLAARSYAARFTIRFNPVRTLNFIHGNGLTPSHAAQYASGPINADTGAETSVAAPINNSIDDNNAADPPAETRDQPNNPAQSVPLARTAVVLPVLDIGEKTVLWGDPNPWREVWQQRDFSPKGFALRVPLGDIADFTDVPDARFLHGGRADITNLLNRYQAGSAYIVIAKNQGSGGVLVTLYRHDGNRLNFIKKMIITARPGYMFNDAVPATVQMISFDQNKQPATRSGQQQQQQPDVRETEAAAEMPAPAEGATASAGEGGRQTDITVTVPYQSLQQWVGIQSRLRQTSGVVALTPIRLSPSSARIRLTINAASVDELKNTLSAQGFDLQYLPTGEIVIIGK